MKTSVTFTPLLLCLFSLFVVTTAHATPIYLNTFFASAPPVAVVDDGSEATIVEEIHVMTQFLSNDPTLGDPEVMIAGDGISLSFEYHFVEGVDNDDEFSAFILDDATGAPVDGLVFFTQATSAGTVSFNLSGLTGQRIGLQFELTAFDFTADSSVTISKVRLESTSAVIPEPSTVILLTIGVLCLAMMRCLRSRRSARTRRSV